MQFDCTKGRFAHLISSHRVSSVVVSGLRPARRDLERRQGWKGARTTGSRPRDEEREREGRKKTCSRALNKFLKKTN